ncbi:MAG: cytochrome c [Bacteroidales bacterium]|nr:cytochrome c [Bacteroidales bacterium]
MKNSKIVWTILLYAYCNAMAVAQEKWVVPETNNEMLSILIFDEEIQLEGKLIYTRSCRSCHGNPTKADFTIMAPSPGDIASDQYQDQTDGSLFYKIQKGRGSMPSFENGFSEEEIWSLVSYIRSFNPDYQQTLPNLEGIEIPNLTLHIDYDENVDNLVVKVTSDSLAVMADASVKAYIAGMFGKYFLGSEMTNELGIAYFHIDSKIPGDTDGYLDILVKTNKDYGTAKLAGKVRAGKPTIKKSAIEGRHLWSTAGKAPVWMIIIFNMMGIGIWGAIIYIIFGLRKFKKLP